MQQGKMELIASFQSYFIDYGGKRSKKSKKKKYDADPDNAFLALDVELFERKNRTEQFHR